MELQKDLTEPETCSSHISTALGLLLATEEKSSVFTGCLLLMSHLPFLSIALCHIQRSSRQLNSSKPHVHDLHQSHVISLEEHPQSAWFFAQALPLTAKVTSEGADSSSVPVFLSANLNTIN